MTEQMKDYVKKFDRTEESLQNELFMTDLSINEKIDAMEFHEDMRKKYESLKEDICCALNWINALSYNDGLNVWCYDLANGDKISGDVILTDYILNTYFPVNTLLNDKTKEWIEDYRNATDKFLSELINIRKKYNNL